MENISTILSQVSLASKSTRDSEPTAFTLNRSISCIYKKSHLSNLYNLRKSPFAFLLWGFSVHCCFAFRSFLYVSLSLHLKLNCHSLANITRKLSVHCAHAAIADNARSSAVIYTWISPHQPLGYEPIALVQWLHILSFNLCIGVEPSQLTRIAEWQLPSPSVTLLAPAVLVNLIIAPHYPGLQRRRA